MTSKSFPPCGCNLFLYPLFPCGSVLFLSYFPPSETPMPLLNHIQNWTDNLLFFGLKEIVLKINKPKKKKKPFLLYSLLSLLTKYIYFFSSIIFAIIMSLQNYGDFFFFS